MSDIYANDEDAADDARARAEIAIQRILIELGHVTGKRIDEVSVDTRNFANCNVEISFSDPTSTTGEAGTRG